MKKYGCFFVCVTLLISVQSSYSMFKMFSFGETKEQKQKRLLKEEKQKKNEIVEQWNTLKSIFTNLEDDYEEAVALWDGFQVDEFQHKGDTLALYQEIASYKFKESDKKLQDKFVKLVTIIKKEQAKQKEELVMLEDLEKSEVKQAGTWEPNEINATKKAYRKGRKAHEKQLELDKKTLKKQKRKNVRKLDLKEVKSDLVEWGKELEKINKESFELEKITEHRKRYQAKKDFDKKYKGTPKALSAALFSLQENNLFVGEFEKSTSYKNETIKQLLARQLNTIKRVIVKLGQLKDPNTGKFVFSKKTLDSFREDYKYNEKKLISRQTPYINQVTDILRKIDKLPHVDRTNPAYEEQRLFLTEAINRLNTKYSRIGILSKVLK